MPKVKTSLMKSKKLASMKKFKFKSPQLYAVLALVVIVGGYLVFKTFAASAIYRFYWNSTGINHQIGVRGDRVPYYYYDNILGVIQDGTRKTVTTWEWVRLDGYSGYIQFGPYRNFTVVNGANTMHVCFNYGAFNSTFPNQDNYGNFTDTVYTDAQYVHNGSRVRLVSKTENVKWEPASLVIDQFGYDKGIYVPIHRHCMDVYLRAGSYPFMEFRLKVTGSSHPAYITDRNTTAYYDGGLVLYYTAMQFR